MNKEQAEAILRLANTTGREFTRVISAQDAKGWIAWSVSGPPEQDLAEVESLLTYRDERFPTESEALIALVCQLASNAQSGATGTRFMATNRRDEAKRLDEEALKLDARYMTLRLALSAHGVP